MANEEVKIPISEIQYEGDPRVFEIMDETARKNLAKIYKENGDTIIDFGGEPEIPENTNPIVTAINELKETQTQQSSQIANKADKFDVDKINEDLTQLDSRLSESIAKIENTKKDAQNGLVWTANEDGAGWSEPQGDVSREDFDKLKDSFTHATEEYTEVVDIGAMVKDSWYANNGMIQSVTGYSRTGRIKCEGMYAIVANITTEDHRVAFFDSNGAKISPQVSNFHLVANRPYLVPENAYEIGISGVTSDMENITLCSVKKGVFYKLNSDTVKKCGLENRNSQMITDDNGNIVPHKFFDNSYSNVATNLFDKNRLIIGYDLDGLPRGNYATMDYYLPVHKGVKYCIADRVVIYQQWGYDEYYNVVTKSLGLSSVGKYLDDAVKYIRLCVYWGHENTEIFGIYANMEEYKGVYTNAGEILPYYDSDKAFADYLNNKIHSCKQTAINANDTGRYSGVVDLNKYDRLVHPKNYELAIHSSEVGDGWYERGVKEYFSATAIEITNKTGTNRLYPSQFEANVGDTLYIGFLAKSNSGQHQSARFVNTYTPVVNEKAEFILFDDAVRNYEFSINITEDIVTNGFKFHLDAPIEFSNIYIRKKSNKKYQHIFNDPLRMVAVNKIISRKFENCTWSAFGDSITDRGYYHQYAREQMPFGTFTNHGIGGSCAVDLGTNSGSVLIDTFEDEIKTADLVTIAYGCNDTRFFGKRESPSTGRNVELGTIENIGADHDKGTFYGALQYMIEKILTWNPKCKIVMVIQPSNTCISSLTNINMDEIHLAEQTVQAQIDVANLYRIPYADFFHKCGLVYGFNATTYIPDGVHPTKQFGYNCSRELVSILDRICVNEKEIEV